MASLATIASVATIGAAVIGAGASIYSGFQTSEAARATAAREEARGRQEFAAAQADALERKFQGQLLASRQQAVAAASGGGAGADAPTIVKLMADTGERTDYAVRSAIYAGESARDNYYASAAARRRSGDNTFIGGFLEGLGSLAGGIGTWAEAQA